MKKILLTCLTTFILSSVFAQQSAISATYGIINPKLRVQYEYGFNDNMSTGVNLNYYFLNWVGPKTEAIYRVYFGRDGNERGIFMQGKAGVGFLSNAWDGDLSFVYDGIEYDIFKSDTWTTVGGGVAFGGKMVSRSGFVFESQIGCHFWTPPNNYSNGYDNYYDLYSAGMNLAEVIGWYLTTGLPVDIQMKIGWQF